MTLQAWIEKTGPKKVAAMMGVDNSTVYTWGAGQSLPRAHHLKKIVKVTRGRVSYKQMVEHVVKNQKNK